MLAGWKQLCPGTARLSRPDCDYLLDTLTMPRWPHQIKPENEAPQLPCFCAPAQLVATGRPGLILSRAAPESANSQAPHLTVWSLHATECSASVAAVWLPVPLRCRD